MARKGTLQKVIQLPNGKRKWVYAKTREELEEKILQLKMEMRAGVDISDSTIFADYVQMWYNAYKKPNITSGTAMYYKGLLNNHILPYLGNMKVRDITPMQVTTLLGDLSKRYSKSHQGVILILLKEIFDSAVDNGLILRSPIPKGQKPMGRARVKKQALTEEQENTLLERVSARSPEAYLLTLMALKTGMRIGEIIALDWEHIDLDKRIIRVQKTLAVSKDERSFEVVDRTKSSAGIRDIPIPESLFRALLRVPEKTGLLFEDGKNAEQRVRYALERESSDFGISVTPHVLRHTYITRLVQSGVSIPEVQYLAGHSSSDITLDIYTHYMRDGQFQDTSVKIRSILE